ncbi:MAG: hypothetical protein M9921_13895 [Fimbriimonadaceae bacterium]|nr:hypothetical protein [Fimbriimonadaceae bacterium]
MSAVAAGVLFSAALATLWLLYYVRVYLPRVMDERFGDSMRAFSTGIELRIASHRGLSDRVVPLSLLVGRRLRLPRPKLRDLEMAARLRDIGLCAIPYDLLNTKAPWEWTEADRLTYDRHPEVSAAMLELVPSLQHLAAAVRSHHFDFDPPGGRFVPSRTDIPLNGRILRVVTEYVWQERHQGALLAREVLLAGSGMEFDPKVVDALLEVLRSTRAAEPRSVAVV